MDQFWIISLILLWVIVIFNLILTLALIRRLNAQTQAQPQFKVGETVPDFSAYNLTGETVTLANFSNEPSIFLFVSPTCTPCREAMPMYKALKPKAIQNGTEIVLVSVADLEQTQAFVREFEVDLPVIVAPQTVNPLMKNYKVQGTPYFCFIDIQHKVRAVGHPGLNAKVLEELLESQPLVRVGS